MSSRIPQRTTGGILITGTGMLAHALAAEAHSRNLHALLIDRAECDITRNTDVDRLFEQHRPAILFNAAAYTNVNGAEDHADVADAVNGHAVGLLASAARRNQTRLIHFSSDFVFDGSQTFPYLPGDPAAPLSAYGRSKLLGETLLQSLNPPGWLILRTAWMFGTPGRCFAQTVLDRAKAGKPLKVVNDQVGSPSFADDVAAAAFDLVEQNATGLYHAVNAGLASWYQFTTTLLNEFGITADVGPITTADWLADHPNDAPRPAYSVLSIDSLEQTLRRPMRPWTEALKAFRRKTSVDRAHV